MYYREVVIFGMANLAVFVGEVVLKMGKKTVLVDGEI